MQVCLMRLYSNVVILRETLLTQCFYLRFADNRKFHLRIKCKKIIYGANREEIDGGKKKNVDTIAKKCKIIFAQFLNNSTTLEKNELLFTEKESTLKNDNDFDEKVKVDLMNTNGQKVMKSLMIIKIPKRQ